MSAYSTTFSGEIERVAAGLGRAPTPEQTDTLNAVLQTLAEIDIEGGTIRVEGEPIDAYLARQAAGFAPIQATSTPSPAETSDMVLLKLNGSTGYRRRGDHFVQITNALNAADDAALAKEMKSWANPWRPGRGFNRTRQAILTNKAPGLAATMKAEISA